MTATSKGEAGEAKIEILKTYYACAHALIFNKRQFGLSKIKSLQNSLTSLTNVTLITLITLITLHCSATPPSSLATPAPQNSSPHGTPSYQSCSTATLTP